MNHTTTFEVRSEDELGVYLESTDGLRTVLAMIHAVGPEGWRTLPVASDLLMYAQRRFANVARSWHRPPEDAAHAAFLAMRAPGILKAHSPWAVVHTAVVRSLMAELHGERNLQSPDRARRAANHPLTVPVRAGEYEETLLSAPAPDQSARPTDAVDEIVQAAAALLATVGWSTPEAAGVVEYICQRVADLGSQESAIDVLRRDTRFREQVGLSKPAWAALLRLLIGTKPSRTGSGTPAVLVRILSGHSLADLVTDPQLRDLAARTLPRVAA